MTDSERYEVNSRGEIVTGEPVALTTAERKSMIEDMFSINGWEFTVLEEVTSMHYRIKMKNDSLNKTKTLHLYHANIRKEDPDRNREEKKIQLGTENDPREHFDDAIILGFYVYENKTDISDAVIVAWPVEEEKNYPANPSLRVNTKNDILKAKNIGFYVDRTTGKNLVVFRPEFIYHYIENYRMLHYGELSDENTIEANLCYQTNLDANYPRNRIIFGAPGTGKSYKLDREKDDLLNDERDYERVTFHQDYSYANFVGTYKPVPVTKKATEDEESEEDTITYKYVPGPFMRTLVAALKSGRTNNPKPYLLIIEEINRANVAAVFGDVFQLLDRKQNVSEYPIQTSEDMRAYLAKELGGEESDYAEIRIPDNMFIWASMNSADQGVFPMDTAFKRRWDFTYIGINEGEEDIIDEEFEIAGNPINWNDLRIALNNRLLSYNVNEDKLMGAHFISKENLKSTELFIDTFKNKVIMYLFEDAAKHLRPKLFKECVPNNLYSAICEAFDKDGITIFGLDIFKDMINASAQSKTDENNDDSSED